jgi:hypothetical protein
LRITASAASTDVIQTPALAMILVATSSANSLHLAGYLSSAILHHANICVHIFIYGKFNPAYFNKFYTATLGLFLAFCQPTQADPGPAGLSTSRSIAKACRLPSKDVNNVLEGISLLYQQSPQEDAML